MVLSMHIKTKGVGSGKENRTKLANRIPGHYEHRKLMLQYHLERVAHPGKAVQRQWSSRKHREMG